MGDVIRYDFDGVPDPCAVIGIPRSYGEYVKHMHYAALLARHNALVEAVAKMLITDDALYDARQNGDASDEYEIRAKAYASARAEVDRLIANESAADCKGEG